MATAETRATIQRMYEYVNAGDLDGLVGLVTDDFVVHTPVPGIGSGPEGLRQLMSIYFSSFPIQHVDVNDIVAEGDRVAVRHTHHLTQNGEFIGLPPSGKQAVIEGIEVFRVVDGKIAEMWHGDDFLGLMQQLGAIPSGEPQSATVAN